MATVIFYSFVLFVSTLFVWLSEKGRTRWDRAVLLLVAFIIVFVPSAIRYDIGTDYLSYVDIFDNQSRLDSYKYKEPAFFYLNYFLSYLGASAQWLIASLAFIFTVVAFKAYPKKNAWLLHFLFLSMLWFFSFNGIRQAVAVSFCLLALFYYFDKRYVLFFVFTFIGALFHQSVIAVSLLGLLALIPISDSFKAKAAPVLFLSILVFSFFNLEVVIGQVEQTLDMLGLSSYSAFFESDRHFVARDFGTGLGVLVNLVFSFYFLLNVKSVLKVNRQYWLLIVLVLAYALGLILASKIIIFERMVIVFTIAPVVAAYVLFHLGNNKIANKIVCGCFLVFLAMSFLKNSLGTETSYSDPKRNPYQTVFTEK